MEERLWFGTREYSRWLPAPLSGADMNPEGWSAGGTLISGGGYQISSFNSHKVYTFGWSDASSPEVAQCMKSYADGSFGRGLIYFQDPHAYARNILPARWADPGMTVEATPIARGAIATSVLASGFEANQLPVFATQIVLNATSSNFRGTDDALYIPIPQGYTLHIGAIYTYTGQGGIFVTPAPSATSVGTNTRLTQLPVNSATLTSHSFSGVPGVWLWVGKVATGNASVTVNAMTARLAKTGSPAPNKGPWIGGMGHSGVRFASRPTWTANSGVNEGQVGFAASFREVGSWIYA